jgi:hypothetical protein
MIPRRVTLRMPVPALLLGCSLALAGGESRSAAATGQAGSARTGGSAGTWTVPRTPWGHPDLQGIWTTQTLTPLERPADLRDKAFLTPEEAAAIEKRAADAVVQESRNRRPNDPGTYNSFWLENGDTVQPDRRTSLIIDPPTGRIPWRAEVLEANRRAASQPATYDSWSDLDTGERCLTDGPTVVDSQGYNMNFRIVQTADHVVIAHEMFHQYVIVPLDGRPRLSRNLGFWLGDGRGRWEGSSLVVETTNFADKLTDKSRYKWAGGGWRAARPTLRLVERFTRVRDDMIDYQFTIDDPTMFTRPWTAAVAMMKTPGPIFEYACHEGNRAVENTLRGARARDRDGEATNQVPVRR